LYYSGRKGFLGLSAPKLLENSYGTVTTSVGETAVLSERRHYFLSGGYVFTLSPSVKLRPMFMAKAVEGSPLSIDLSAMAILRDRLWLGVAYRNADSFSAIAAFQITDQFRVGYAHDFTISTLRKYNSGTHELMLSYDMRFNKDKLLSPRYF
jgi:type IX secretion system PorP/SprF family membrane protein